jgi:hypothetical protein
MIHELNSVGCVIDSETLNIYPKLSEGGHDIYNSAHIDDCCDEWFDSLSDEDFIKIKSLKK